MNTPIARRVQELDWRSLHEALDTYGFAELPRLLSADECDALFILYSDASRFRSRVDMERHRFGRGEYKYFSYPLPSSVRTLREAFYPPLAEAANRWAARLGLDERYPACLQEYIALCNTHGQTRPTPLLLYYEADGYNCLHQDVYGEIGFPFQVVLLLSERGSDYEGGELVLLEQRPRAQSVAHVVTPARGAGLIFPNRVRPVQGARGFYRVNVRHGVSCLKGGQRMSLGIIFHDAK